MKLNKTVFFSCISLLSLFCANAAEGGGRESPSKKRTATAVPHTPHPPHRPRLLPRPHFSRRPRLLPRPDKWGALHDAAFAGDATKIYSLFNPTGRRDVRLCPANPNRRAPGGITALRLAVAGNHLKAVEALLANYKIFINPVDTEGNVPLHFVKSAETAKLLLEKRANVSHRNNAGQTPLELVELSGYKGAAAVIRRSIPSKTTPDAMRARMLESAKTESDRSKASARKDADGAATAFPTCFCCLDTIEDDASQLYTCSHLVHGSCAESLTSNGFTQCSICQANLSASVSTKEHAKAEKAKMARSELTEYEQMLAIAAEDPRFFDD